MGVGENRHQDAKGWSCERKLCASSSVSKAAQVEAISGRGDGCRETHRLDSGSEACSRSSAVSKDTWNRIRPLKEHDPGAILAEPGIEQWQLLYGCEAFANGLRFWVHLFSAVFRTTLMEKPRLVG